jgi:hypothetical protein
MLLIVLFFEADAAQSEGGLCHASEHIKSRVVEILENHRTVMLRR